MPLISIRAYARLRGLKSDNSVRKAIATGKITLVGGQIDPEIADADWSRNRDAGQESKLADAIEAAPVSEKTAEFPAEPLPSPVAEPSTVQQQLPIEPPAVAPLTAARIRSTEETATIKEITRRKLEGGLLEAEEIDRDWCGLFQIFKDRLRALPDDAVPALFKCESEEECRSLLIITIDELLKLIVKDVRKMAAA